MLDFFLREGVDGRPVCLSVIFDIVGLDEGTCGRRLVCVPCKVVRAR